MDNLLLQSLKSLKPDEANEVKLIDAFITNHASTYVLKDPYYENLIQLIFQNRVYNTVW